MEKFLGTAAVAGAALAVLTLAPAAAIRAAAPQGRAGQPQSTPAKGIPRTSWDGKPDLT